MNNNNHDNNHCHLRRHRHHRHHRSTRRISSSTLSSSSASPSSASSLILLTIGVVCMFVLSTFDVNVNVNNLNFGVVLVSAAEVEVEAAQAEAAVDVEGDVEGDVLVKEKEDEDEEEMKEKEKEVPSGATVVDPAPTPNSNSESESNSESNSESESDDAATTPKAPSSTPTKTTATTTSTTTDTTTQSNLTKEEEPTTASTPTPPIQSGPLIDLFGETLLSLEMVDNTHARLNTHYTNEILANSKVIGLYFSADWCGPCRQFTPELVNFYNRINSRGNKGKNKNNNTKNNNKAFEIIWISRCRDTQSFGQYFTQMGGWLALPPEEALGQRGQTLFEQFKTQGIPHLVLIDEMGSVITYNGRNKVPADRAGIGFPWRNPLATLYVTFVPKTLRMVFKSRLGGVKDKVKRVLAGAGGRGAGSKK